MIKFYNQNIRKHENDKETGKRNWQKEIGRQKIQNKEQFHTAIISYEELTVTRVQCQNINYTYFYILYI